MNICHFRVKLGGLLRDGVPRTRFADELATRKPHLTQPLGTKVHRQRYRGSHGFHAGRSDRNTADALLN